MSLENLFNILPVGFLSKNNILVHTTPNNIFLWRDEFVFKIIFINILKKNIFFDIKNKKLFLQIFEKANQENSYNKKA